MRYCCNAIVVLLIFVCGSVRDYTPLVERCKSHPVRFYGLQTNSVKALLCANNLLMHSCYVYVILRAVYVTIPVCTY